MLNETEATIKRQYTTCVCGSVVSNSLPPHGLQPARLPCPRNSPGKNTGVGCHSLLQGIFPTQGMILQCRQILYRVSHQRSLVSTHTFAIFPSSQTRKLRVIIVFSLMYQFWNVPWLQFFPIHSWTKNHPDPALIPRFLLRTPRFHLPPTLNSETGLILTKQHIY